MHEVFRYRRLATGYGPMSHRSVFGTLCWSAMWDDSILRLQRSSYVAKTMQASLNRFYAAIARELQTKVEIVKPSTGTTSKTDRLFDGDCGRRCHRIATGESFSPANRTLARGQAAEPSIAAGTRAWCHDDTEHTCLVAQSILRSGGQPAEFGRDLAKRLRWWLLGLPAGTGRATAKACIKLWLGKGYQSSGIWSAGNGPAMRSAIIGVAIQSPEAAIRLTEVSARITHSDPKALYGALAVSAGGPPGCSWWRCRSARAKSCLSGL